MICPKCNKDHTVRGEGELSVCEREAYLRQGAEGMDPIKHKKITAFGLGQGRFQFDGAK